MAHAIEIDGVWTQSTAPHDELLRHCKTVIANSFPVSYGGTLPSGIIELFIVPDDGFAINALDFENKTLSTYNDHPELFNHNPSDWLMVNENTNGFQDGVRFTNTNSAADSPGSQWVAGNQVKAEVMLDSSYVPTSDMNLQLDFYNKNAVNLTALPRSVTIAFIEPVTLAQEIQSNFSGHPRTGVFNIVPAEGVTHYSARLQDNIPSEWGNPRFHSPQSVGASNVSSIDLNGVETDYTYLSGNNGNPYIHYLTTDVVVDETTQLGEPKVLANISIGFELEYPSSWNGHQRVKDFYSSTVAPNWGAQLVFGFAKEGGTDDFETNPAKCVQILPHDNVLESNNYVDENHPSKFSQQNIKITSTVNGMRYVGVGNSTNETVVTGISYDLVFTENYNNLKPENCVGCNYDSNSTSLLNSEHPIGGDGTPVLQYASINGGDSSYDGYMLGFESEGTNEPQPAGYWNDNLKGYFWNLNYTCGQGWYTDMFSMYFGSPATRNNDYAVQGEKQFAIRNIRTNFNKISGSKSSNMIPSGGVVNGRGEITVLGDPGAQFKVLLKEVESGINDSDTAQTGVSKSGGYATADITASILNGGEVKGMPTGFIKIPSSGAYVIKLPEIERLKSQDVFKVFELHLVASSNTKILNSALNGGGVLKKPTIQGSDRTSNASAVLINKYYQYPLVGVKFNALNHGGAAFSVGYRPIDIKPFGGRSILADQNSYGAKPLSKSGQTKSFQFRQRKGGATFSINTTVLTPNYAADGTTVAYYSIPSKFFTESIRNNGEKYVIQARAHIGAGLQDTSSVADCTIDIQVRLLKYGKLPQELTIDFKEIFIES